MAGSETDLSAPAVEVVEEELVVIGADRPKVIHWEDLQQELARLWSLSSELNKAKEIKDSLSQRIQSMIEARSQFLVQRNELEEMRQKVEARNLVMGNLLLRRKRMSEEVMTRREDLSYRIRWLLVAGKTLSAAQQQLQEAKRLLAGERGQGHLKSLQNMLKSRQQYMVTQVSMLYPLKCPMAQTSGKILDQHSIKSRDRAEIPSSNASKSPQLSSLTILGLQLITPPLKKMSFFGDKKEVQRSASAFGYVAHAVSLIASYLDVPLRYPLRLGGSRSYIIDYAPSTEPTSSDLTSSSITGMIVRPSEFPLFLEGQDTTRAAYAIFLLNKDLEQLLNHIGGQSLGPRHVLANLRELIRIVHCPEYICR